MISYSFKVKHPAYMFGALMVAKANIESYRDLYLSGRIPEQFNCDSEIDYNFHTTCNLLVGRYHGLIEESLVPIGIVNDVIFITFNHDNHHIAEVYLGLLMFGAYQLTIIGQKITAIKVTRKDKSALVYHSRHWYHEGDRRPQLYSEL